MSAPQRSGRSKRAEDELFGAIDRQAAAGPDSFRQSPQRRDSHFAWIRTRLSLDTALMAWARAAAALIGFGFAIVQFSEGFDAL